MNETTKPPPPDESDSDEAHEHGRGEEHEHVHGPGCAHDHAPAKPIVRSEAKVGRNDPCPCGSGAKFKKCCGR